jgi:hypothetical protein
LDIECSFSASSKLHGVRYSTNVFIGCAWGVEHHLHNCQKRHEAVCIIFSFLVWIQTRGVGTRPAKPILAVAMISYGQKYHVEIDEHQAKTSTTLKHIEKFFGSRRNHVRTNSSSLMPSFTHLVCVKTWPGAWVPSQFACSVIQTTTGKPLQMTSGSRQLSSRCLRCSINVYMVLSSNRVNLASSEPLIHLARMQQST